MRPTANRKRRKGSNLSKGNTVSENTTAAVNSAKKAAEKLATVVAENAPVVEQVVELAVEVPATVKLNQKVVVLASAAVGGVLTGAAIWGYNKIRDARATKKLEAEAAELLTEKNPANS